MDSIIPLQIWEWRAIHYTQISKEFLDSIQPSCKTSIKGVCPSRLSRLWIVQYTFFSFWNEIMRVILLGRSAVPFYNPACFFCVVIGICLGFFCDGKGSCNISEVFEKEN